MKPDPNLRTFWWAGLAAVVVIFAVLLSDPRYNVITMLKLEFASSQEAFFNTIAASGYTKAFLEKCLYIDYAFIVAFTSLFYCSTFVLSAKYDKKLSFYHRSFVLLPGLLDVIENVIMLHMIRHGAVSGLTYNLQMIMVYSKWVIVIPCCILAIMAFYNVVANK